MATKIHQMGSASSTPSTPIIGISAAPAALESTAPGVEVVEVNGKPRAYVNDRRGRRIGVRVVEFLDQYRLAKILGDQSQNFGALNFAIAAVSVVEINGEPVSFPSRESELEALMARLGQDGVAAVARALPALAGDDVDQGAVKN